MAEAKKKLDIVEVISSVEKGQITYGELRSCISKLSKNKEEEKALVNKHTILRDAYYKAVKAFIFSDDKALNESVKV